jgi:hypothetical protein
MVSPYRDIRADHIYLKLEWEKMCTGSCRWTHHLIYSYNFTAALVCRCSCRFDWNINRTGCCRWRRTTTGTGHPSSHVPTASAVLINLTSYLNLPLKAYQATDGFNLLCKTGFAVHRTFDISRLKVSRWPGFSPRRQSPIIHDFERVIRKAVLSKALRRIVFVRVWNCVYINPLTL